MNVESKDYWRIVMRRKWLVLGSLLGSAALAVALNTWTEPVYRATARIEIEKEPKRSLLTGELIDNSGVEADFVALYTAAELITNRALLGQVVDSLKGSGVIPRPEQLMEYKQPVDWLLERVKVEPIRDTRLVNIHVEHSTPESAERIADLVAEFFVEYKMRQRASGSSNLVTYLDRQVSEVKARISSAERQLVGVNHDGLYTSEEKIKQLTETLADLRKKLVASTTELAKAREIFRSRHPKLMVMESENAAIRQSIQQAERELSSINARIRQYSVLESELKSNRELYAVLNAKLQEAEINGQLVEPLVRVIEPAVANPVPVRPRKVLNLAVCLMAGLLMGLGLAFLREYLRRTIRTPKDVDEYLNLPVLGLVPKVS